MVSLNNWNMIGVLVAIIFVNINFGNKAGTPPTFAFNLPPYIRNGSIFLGDFHLHHWLICLILLGIFVTLQVTNRALLIMKGIWFVLLCQGLLYEDRFDF